jgi:hypothetical protein
MGYGLNHWRIVVMFTGTYTVKRDPTINLSGAFMVSQSMVKGWMIEVMP